MGTPRRLGGSPEGAVSFQGYAPPTSSTTFTPNQFYDVVLPTASRGALRLVSYLIRKTLGWSDRNGNPQNPDAAISYRELSDRAGIGRGRVKEAIDEAVERRFIECLRFGRPHKSGEEGYSARYSLKWGTSDRYITDPDEFDGFFAGLGNLTHIPNQFFDLSVPTLNLSVVKVVGVIIRNTIGFQTKFGFRRQEAALSFTDIMRKTGIGSRTTVSEAIRTAVDGKHIRLVSKGVFDQNAGQNSKAAVYAVNWSDDIYSSNPEVRTIPRRGIRGGEPSQDRLSPSNYPAPKADRGLASQNGPGDVPGSGPKTAPKVDSERLPNWTAIRNNKRNNTLKQQQVDAEEVVAEGKRETLDRLVSEGIEKTAARRLLADFSLERIQRQLEWLPSRPVRSSRTGFLIRAIEIDMPAPANAEHQQTSGNLFAAHFYAEIAGNPDQPISEPSSEETRASGNLLAKLKATESPNELGRGFARLVLSRKPETRSRSMALTFALRQFGDAFLKQHRESQIATGASESLEERRAHEQRMRSRYEAHIAATVRGLESNPKLIQEFETDSDKKLASFRKVSERGYEMLRHDLQTKDGRAQLFLEFLQRKHPVLLPNFWQWDSNVNDYPFQSKEQRD